MGSLVGILSTVILVSTLMTLAFAVYAYIGSRKRLDTERKQRHSGDYPIPKETMSPELPEEFVLRMHDIHIYAERDQEAESPASSTKATGTKGADAPAVSKEEERPRGGAAGTNVFPVFRSLAEKKAQTKATESSDPEDRDAPADKA